MQIEGGCHCGYITYEAEIDSEKVGICHCTDCQTLTGSAFTSSVPAAKEGFSLRTGQPKIYVKTAESGAKRAQAFCPDADRGFIRPPRLIHRHSTSGLERYASGENYGQQHKFGAALHLTGSWT